MDSSTPIVDSDKVLIFEAKTNKTIHSAIQATLDKHSAILPSDTSAKIVIKPNLNSNMNALTGNTTDLRILTALITSLQARGYDNITIAEGTNSGFYRQGINVISRLRVDRVAERFHIQVKDTNYDDSVEIEFEGGEKAQAAKTFVDADFLINLPKIKMHYEAEMSVCLKNLIGTLVGMQNKKKVHNSLIKNICNINKYIKPDLHIVDGVIAMEGNGPTTGTPRLLGALMAGTNPFILDMAAAKVTQCPIECVPVLMESKRRGDITAADAAFIDALDLSGISQPFLRPKLPLQTRIATNKKLQKYFLKVRHAPGLRNFFNSGAGNRLLFKLKLTQEVMIYENPEVQGIAHTPEECKHCGICVAFCPMSLDPRDSNREGCIQCMYCYCVCPNKLFEIQGNAGFFEEQIKQYDAIVRAYSPNCAPSK